MKKTVFVIAVFLLTALPAAVFAEYAETTALKNGSLKFAQGFGRSLAENAEGSRAITSYGNTLMKLKNVRDLDVNAITLKNPDFWKAIIDAQNSPSVYTTYGFLLSALGLADKAEPVYLLASLQLSQEQREMFLGGYLELSDALNEKVKADMDAGIKYHDEEDYDKAIKAYDAVLAGYPGSAWAWYEKGFTYRMISMKNKGSDKTAEEAYAMARELDPIYFTAYQGSNKAVIAKLMVLMKKVYPFTSGGKRTLDTLADFAYGCEETGLHDYAAFAFWQLHYLYEGREQEMLAHFYRNAAEAGCPKVIEYADKQVAAEALKIQ